MLYLTTHSTHFTYGYMASRYLQKSCVDDKKYIIMFFCDHVNDKTALFVNERRLISLRGLILKSNLFILFYGYYYYYYFFFFINCI